jgi:glycosyltransferase involved in cell wall biosynthesis
MKVLCIMPRPLFPTDAGGKIRSLNIFSRLSPQVKLHTMALVQPGRDDQGAAAMRKTFSSFTAVPWKEAVRFSPAFYTEFFTSRFDRLPYFLSKYNRAGLLRTAQELHAREQFDLILCDFLHAAVPFTGSALRPRVIFQHNVEYRIRRLHWEREANPLKKWLLRAEWEKARAAEQAACRDCDHVITVSADDAQVHRAEFGITQVSDIPTGVDVEYFQPAAGERRPGNMVFVGSLDWYPNEEGLLWFLREIYPQVRQGAAQANLTIVGRNPSAAFRQLAESLPGVEVAGSVPDVRPYLARAEAVLVPLRIGGGTRIKIFEAMAAGRAVVSTTLGAEGLPVTSGEELIRADEPADFAREVVALLQSPARRAHMESAARARVVRDHTWQAVARRMEAIFEQVVQNAASGEPATAPAQPVLAQ